MYDIFGQKRIIIFDGAMGTEIQNNGIKLGEVPEVFNIEQSDIVIDIHKAYKNAGADVLTTNTFGANALKLKRCNYSVEQIISAGIINAKKASDGDCLVALGMGSLGEMLYPVGTLSDEKAYELYKEQAVLGEKYGADLIIIETMTDLHEARVAVMACKENTKLPVFCTMSFEENGRTFMGAMAESAAVSLSSLADAVGINCSLGPAEILPIAQKILKYAKKPVIIQPNAGLPKMIDGKTVYDITAEEFSDYGVKFAEMGASILGGCCGTTPEHIRLLKQKLKNFSLVEPKRASEGFVCSSSEMIDLDRVRVIGERINPTGKKLFKEALKNNDFDYILKQGIEQSDAGADILDVNLGLPDTDEIANMIKVVSDLQGICSCPLQIDSSSPEVIEAGLRAYNGKAIVNSVNGNEKSINSILPLIKKYGAVVIGLTLDENGIPKTAEGRFEIAQKILSRAESLGIAKENVVIDCLTLTVSAQQEDCAETLKAVRMIKEKLGLKTVLGVSNISFGLPKRDIINEAFLAEALANGLDMPIINPNSEGMMRIVYAHNVLCGTDKNSEKYIEKFSGMTEEKTISSEHTITDIIVKGLKDEAREKTKKMLEQYTELELVDNYLIPALDTVGEKYEKNIIFLPQLIASAETVQRAFDVIKERLSADNTISKGTILLATVKGDIHDIGKNIVKVILENYGYRIVDLGKDVAPEKVVETIKKNNIKLVGLSALMTTTVVSMEQTIRLIREIFNDVKVMVGGAVLTEEYAEKIGADYYTKDAKASVKVAKEFFK